MYHVNLSMGAIREGWVDPHAWERPSKLNIATPIKTLQEKSDSIECPSCPSCPETKETNRPEDSLGEFMYRKLINFMVNKEHMKYDQDTEEYHRTINIRVNKDQYSRIRSKEGDLRTMDGVLQVEISFLF